MNYWLFIALSAGYIISLAVIDGCFNRLIFRESRAAAYGSPEKQAIYQLPEWRIIGILFLVVLPVIIPSIASLAIGGFRYLTTYLALLLLIQWDVIFGRIVFGRWLGDTPSIALPRFGWIHFPLIPVILVRVLAAVLLLLMLD